MIDVLWLMYAIKRRGNFGVTLSHCFSACLTLVSISVDCYKIVWLFLIWRLTSWVFCFEKENSPVFLVYALCSGAISTGEETSARVCCCPTIRVNCVQLRCCLGGCSAASTYPVAVTDIIIWQLPHTSPVGVCGSICSLTYVVVVLKKSYDERFWTNIPDIFTFYLRSI